MLDKVSHAEALGRMINSSALLLILGEEDNQEGKMYPAKVFEYLASRKPIIAITPPGATADLIGSLGAGRTCSYEDDKSVADAFHHYYGLWQKGEDAHFPFIDLKQYDRKYLTRKLATVFNEILKAE